MLLGLVSPVMCVHLDSLTSLHGRNIFLLKIILGSIFIRFIAAGGETQVPTCRPRVRELLKPRFDMGEIIIVELMAITKYV